MSIVVDLLCNIWPYVINIQQLGVNLGENGKSRYDCILMFYGLHIVFAYVKYHCTVLYVLDLDHADSSLEYLQAAKVSRSGKL